MSQEKLNLSRKVFYKVPYTKVIKTNFTQLVNTVPPPQPAPSFTVDNFFSQYTRLFYDIPQTGDTNSHEYLIKTSSEYINYIPDNEQITALIEEINSLQQENLALNIKLVNLSVANLNTNTSSSI